jgi:hypothetical protein
MIGFSVSNADLDFVASFGGPAFALWREPNQIAEIAYKALSPFGVQMSAMRWDWGQSLGENRLSVAAFDYFGTFEVQRDGLHVKFLELPSGRIEEFSRATSAFLTAFSHPSLGLSYRAHSFTLGLHGSLLNSEVARFIEGFFSRKPEGLGDLAGAACLFSFGSSGDRQNMSLFLEPSNRVQGGLWIRVQATLDPAKSQPDGLRAAIEGLLAKSLTSLGLERLTETKP